MQEEITGNLSQEQIEQIAKSRTWEYNLMWPIEIEGLDDITQLTLKRFKTKQIKEISKLKDTTEQGAKMVDTSPPLLHDRFINSFQNLKEWEKTAILSSLQRIAEMMSAEDLDAAPVLSSGTMDSPISPSLYEK